MKLKTSLQQLLR